MRRAKPEEHKVLPDLRYKSVILQTMILHMMNRGKKSLATRLMYDTMDIIKERSQKNPIDVFETAIKNVAPLMEVRPRRVGGATYQVPMEVSAERRITLAIRWVLASSRVRPGKSFPEKLADEILEAHNETGASIRKRDETHKMAEANRAFSHYRV
ncbi:MAG: 30S ribosomal protein S7 [Anaerolineales bacterium]|jgi:small subunit ribosomal protein S7|nr:30S ribosomal protein S7 [Anaerolineales bacterium]